MSGRVVELQVDLAVLPGLGPVLAVRCGLVSLVVDLSAEGVGELFGGAAAFLAQVVTLSEVLAQVLIIAVGSGLRNKKFNHVAIRFSEKKNECCLRVRSSCTHL